MQDLPRSEREQADAARCIVDSVRATHCTDDVRLPMWFPLFDAPNGTAGDGWGAPRCGRVAEAVFISCSDEVGAAQQDGCVGA